jgi:arylsulfatase A-like enzyme
MSRIRSDRPNVVVFFTDQQRWDTTGVHGNPLGLTPHFDQMSASGTHLYNTFTCQPVCGPARSALQTGLYPTTTGCFRNGAPLPEDQRTMENSFNEAGYHTGYIGKWHLASSNPVPEKQRGGYQYWLGANALEMVSDPYDTRLWNNDNEEVELPGYRVDALTDAAVRYIQDHKEDPFFLCLSYLEPHHQNRTDDYPPPDVYRDAYTGRWSPPDLTALGGSSHQHLGGYYGMVKRLDEALGRIQEALKSLKLQEDTIVLFISDHGCHFKTRNGEYKRSCHESSIRVPSAIQGPGFENGGQIRQLVSLIDLPPTLLDACGIPVPEEMQGRSIKPLLHGDRSSWPEEMFVQISGSQVGRAVRTQRWKYSVSAPGKDGKTHKNSDHYVEEFLYDLQSDPYELTNLAGMVSHREVADNMKERLLSRLKQAGEPTARIEDAPVVTVKQRKVHGHETQQ